MFLLMVFFFAFALSQNIVLFPFIYEDCIDKYPNVFISNFDKILFKSIVNYSTDLNMQSVYFQTKKKHDINYKFVCNLKLSEHCTVMDDMYPCKCKKLMGHILEIEIIINASVSYNDSILRGTVVRSVDHEPKRSEEQLFPRIYDINKELVINGRTIPITNCFCGDHISGPSLSVSFSCASQIANCSIEIAANDSGRPVYGENSAVYKMDYITSQVLNLTIKMYPNEWDGYFNSYSCKIIIAEVFNFACNCNIIDYDLEINCSSARVYPSATCLFFNTQFLSTPWFTEVKSTSFLSQCSLKTSVINVKSGFYNVSVAMYPNITGSETDISFVNTQTVSFMVQELPKDKAINGIAVIAGANGLVIIIGILIGLFKYRGNQLTCDQCIPCYENKNQLNNYDEINQGYILVDYGMYHGNNEYDTSCYTPVEASDPGSNRNECLVGEHQLYESIDDV